MMMFTRSILHCLLRRGGAADLRARRYDAPAVPRRASGPAAPHPTHDPSKGSEAMTISIYTASTPVFVRMLGNLDHILGKALAHAEARKFEPSVFMTARLAPDMFALPRQVQITTDNAKGCIARLAGVEIPKFDDNEASVEELRERVRRTIDFLKSVPAEKFEGADTRQIELKVRGEPLHFSGEDYLRFFALPNFYFHLTTAYALLRHNGVDIGKTDFLGALR
jgi:hypothetical protein